MIRRVALLSFVTAALMVMVGFSAVGSTDQSITCLPSCRGIIDKTQSQNFTVEITFKNIGGAVGAWAVNIAFEGESWTWTGTAQTITLDPGSFETLMWKGEVPPDAAIDSVARLIVYYGDSFKALNWWIHVIPSAELAITQSTVK